MSFQHVATAAAPVQGIKTGSYAFTETRDKPAGTRRITASGYEAKTILGPARTKLLPDYPDIHVEVVAEDDLYDIVRERFDADVRLSAQVEKHMVAVRIGPDMRMAIVGTVTSQA